MKKFRTVLSLMLAMIILVFAVGCESSTTKAVKEKLCGSWGYPLASIDGQCYKFYIFSSDDTYQSIWDNEGDPSKNSESKGTYKIEDSKIILTGEDGEVDTIIKYTLENDELSMIDTYSDGTGSQVLVRAER